MKLEATIKVEDYECSNTVIVEGKPSDLALLKIVLDKCSEVTFTKISAE